MSVRSCLLMLTICVAGFPIFGQDLPYHPYERVLIPLVFESPIDGAHGSSWKTELIAHNAGSHNVEVYIALLCRVQCPQSRFEANETWKPSPNTSIFSAGSFLWARPDDLDRVTFNLLAHEVSRGFGTWGTQIPVVRESDAFQPGERINLLNVPATDDYRTSVRIYSFDGWTSRNFRLLVFSLDTGAVLKDLTVTTTPNETENPGYFFLGNLEEALSETEEKVRIEITSLEGESRFWAFASVTHDDTQHVTLVAPN